MNQRTDRLCYDTKPADSGREVQYILRERLKLSSGMIKTLKYHDGILLDGAPVHGNVPVRHKQTVTALLNCYAPATEILPETGALDIIYEDEAFTVINKPANMVVHTTCLHQSGTLSNYLLGYWQQKGIRSGIHLAGRLDRDTTGIIIAARNGYVQESLKKQSQAGKMKKYYIAAVAPAPKENAGVIDAPIMRDYDSIIKRKIAENSSDGARAVTRYEVIEDGGDYAIAEFLLETGRTHQIRLHCLASGFPVIGDTLYGSSDGNQVPHQLLHAYRVELIHPVTGGKMVFTAAPPKEWGRFAPRTWPLPTPRTL